MVGRNRSPKKAMDKHTSKTLGFRLAQDQQPAFMPEPNSGTREIGPTGSMMLINDGWCSSGPDEVTPSGHPDITIMDPQGQDDIHFEEDPTEPDGRC